jgi:peptidoglycan hydrolase-like protein with peptidoglycan-binding domain
MKTHLTSLQKYLLPAFILLLLVAAAANLAFSYNFAPLAKAQTVSTGSLQATTAADATSAASLCLVVPGSLSVGMQSDTVAKLQDFLRLLGYLHSPSTGYYGALTSAAVKTFQTNVGLPAVGSVGPLTRAVLQKVSCVAGVVPAATIPLPTRGPAPTTSSSSIGTSTDTSSVATSTPTVMVIAATTTPSLPYSAQTFEDWQTSWGSVSTTTTGALHLEGSLQNNGAEAIYPKSMNWTDYHYQADVSVTNGNISLIGRYVDSNNFLACSFAKNWVEIDQVYNGTSTVLVSKSLDGILPGTDGLTKATSVAMDVKGNTVGCAGYGPTDNVTYTLPAGSPTAGGIGVESWYETALADKLDLMSVKVDPL